MVDCINRYDAIAYVVGLIDRIYEGTVAPRELRKEAKQQVINEMNSTDRLPAANVRENVPGKWKEKIIGNPAGGGTLCVSICVCCGVRVYATAVKGDLNFCPNCGADMRGEKK